MPAKLSNAQNVSASNEWGGDDECAKSHEACRVRNNTTHFGAFPGTGRQIPKQ
jgi:phage-related protein